jgi:single-strand DNA-binding protein
MAKGTVNKVIILGRLGNNPEVRTTQNGTVVATMSIATNDGIGEKMTTEWHRIVMFGKSAEAIQRYATKGTQLYLEGRLRTNKYQDKDGNTKYSTEIIANSFQFVGGGNSNSNNNSSYDSSKQSDSNPSNNSGYSNQQKPKQNNMPDFAEINSNNFDDDIPF